MNCGDVFWVNLPDRGGREQRGRRPVIIFQDMASFGSLPTVLVIPLTSSSNSLRFSATLRIDPTPNNGLATSSVAMIFQLGACDQKRVGQQLGKLDAVDLQILQGIAKKLQMLP